MADNIPAPARRGIGDRVKNGAAVIGALAGTMTAVWGVYEKVRAEARKDTAASYNVLAPQINQMNDAVKQLQLENQMLRQIVAEAQNKPRLAQTPPAAPAPSARRPAARRPTISAAGGGAPTAAAGQPAEAARGGGSGPTAAAPAQPPGAPPPAGEPPTAAPPPTTPSGQPAGPASEQTAQNPPAEGGGDPVTGLLNTVGRTRQAIESLKKVPEDFEKVVGKPR